MHWWNINYQIFNSPKDLMVLSKKSKNLLIEQWKLKMWEKVHRCRHGVGSWAGWTNWRRLSDPDLRVWTTPWAAALQWSSRNKTEEETEQIEIEVETWQRPFFSSFQVVIKRSKYCKGRSGLCTLACVHWRWRDTILWNNLSWCDVKVLKLMEGGQRIVPREGH